MLVWRQHSAPEQHLWEDTARHGEVWKHNGRGLGAAPEYAAQAEGYRAFVPKPLPPDPAVRFTAELQPLLSRADQALGRLDGSNETLPDPDLFLLTYPQHEAVLSSQIEGTQSALEDVLAAEARVLSPSRPQNAAEVIDHVAVMHFGLGAVRQSPLTVELLREFHRRLLEGSRGADKGPGDLRERQVWIRAPGSGTAATWRAGSASSCAAWPK